MDADKILARLVQVGIVSTIDAEKRQARVIYKDTGIVSGWLCVLQHRAAGVYVAPDGEHTHTITDSYTGGGAAGTEPAHSHPQSCLLDWMPRVNDRVVVLYLPIMDSDGFILGGI